MENVSGFLRDGSLVGKAAKRLLKGFAFVTIERVMGGNPFGQKLGKLAQLENGGAGIIAKVSLRQRPKLHKLSVVNAQEREIARWQHRSPWPKTYHSLVIR